MEPDEEKIVLFVVVLVIALVTIYLELRLRKIGVGKKVTSSRVKKDQAYNALHTTKAVRNKLRIDRVNTAKADYMIQKAETALEGRDYDSCMDVCRMAREELLRSKRDSGVLSDEPTAASPTEPAEIEVPSPSASPGETIRIQAAGVDNSAQLSAKFELKAAKADIEAFIGDTGIRNRAEQLVKEAEKQLNGRDFQRSLSASFRARKIMSGEVVEEKPPAKEPAKTEEPKKPANEPDGKCNSCGAALESDDVFCHSCGTSLKARKCESCGADLKGFEKFCRKCGKPAQR